MLQRDGATGSYRLWGMIVRVLKGWLMLLLGSYISNIASDSVETSDHPPPPQPCKCQ